MLQQYKYASQVRRLEIEKGTRWAAEYWSINAKKQLNNTVFNGGNPYGKKGDNNWQQTALSEGWGYFMEWTMARDILKWNSFDDTTFASNTTFPQDYKNSSYKPFPNTYTGMFYELNLIGCSYNNLERCLGVYSLQEYKNNLIRYYPYLTNQITQIVTTYENITFN